MPFKKILTKITKFKKRVKITPKIIIVTLVILLALIAFFFKNQILVATVNGQPIWRLTIIRELEKQSGKSALEASINKALILQEAEAQNLVISEETITQELEKIKANLTEQGQDFNQLLAAEGLTLEGLRQQIKFQKIIENLVAKEIQVTDQEIENYYKENKSYFPANAKLADLKANIKEQLMKQKVNEQVQTWIQSLKDKAKINYFLNF